jgi:hypothetical protein
MVSEHHKHNNQPPNRIEGELIEFLLRAAEERAANIQ